jgi:folate-binding protein YgfZ
VKLSDRGLISIAGPDAPRFLQDLITADIESLDINRARYAGLLTPQGKILFDFFIIREEQGYVLDCLLEQREELSKRLKFYRLRAKLEIGTDEREVGAVLDGAAGGGIEDPRTGAMGCRLYGPAASGGGKVEAYHRRRIEQGLAEGGHDFGSGELFPHEANFDQIGAVSFSKGCFVGQEVVSRMEHRGTARSRILPCRIEGEPPPKGTQVDANSKPIGTVCSGAGNRLLALLRLDRLEEAHDAKVPLRAGSARVMPMKPSWARYSVPVFD